MKITLFGLDIDCDFMKSRMTRRTQYTYIVISVILGASFIMLSYLVNRDLFRDIDYQTMVSLQNAISRKFDVPFSFFTILGSTEFTFILLAFIFMTILFKYKHIFLGLLLYFLIFAIELSGKLLIFHPDPPEMFNRYSLDIHLPIRSFIDTNFSYPSGHMTRSTFLMVIILFFLISNNSARYKKITATFLVIIYLGIVLVSRIYLGEHWLSDVIGGLLLGTSIATLAISFW